jgi:predicted branched-subunit amino acid permease
MNRADFVEGLRGGSAVALASAPLGALFGALAVENGMSLSEAAFMSATVYAGASQMSASNSSVTMSTLG